MLKLVHFKNLNIFLMYAGSLPFILLSAAVVSDLSVLPYLGSTINLLAIYGLVIGSFLAGVHWGQYLASNNKESIKLLLTSNIVAISLWIVYATLPIKHYLVVLIFVFITLLLIDLKLYNEQKLEHLYCLSRVIVTSIVVLSLGVSLYVHV